MLKRLLCAILICTMLLPTAACSQDPAEKADTPDTTASVQAETETTAAPETEPPIISAALPMDKTFDGHTFTIGADGDTVLATIYAEEENGETINDAVIERNRLVEEQFDVTVLGTRLPGDITASVTQAVAAGDNSWDIVSGHDCTMWELTMTGNFLNVREMPYMDFSQPWYPSYANDTYCIGGKQYMFTSYLSSLSLAWAQCFLINKGIAADNNIVIPYEEVLNGTWTLDRMIALAEGVAQDLNGDGTMNASDLYGLATGSKMYSFQGSYVDCYTRGTDGRISLEFDREKLIALCEKMLAFMTGPDGYVSGQEPSDTMFNAGQSLYNYTKLLSMTTEALRESDIEYGVLPIPKWTEEQKDYISSTSDRQFAFLAHTEDPVRSGILTEALSSAGYHIIREAYFETALSTKFAPDKESIEMLNIISNTLAVDLSFLNTSSGTTGLGRTVMFALTSKNNALSSYFAKLVPAEQKTVDKINKFYFEQ